MGIAWLSDEIAGLLLLLVRFYLDLFHITPFVSATYLSGGLQYLEGWSIVGI